jgi:hypothetical protein
MIGGKGGDAEGGAGEQADRSMSEKPSIVLAKVPILSVENTKGPRYWRGIRAARGELTVVAWPGGRTPRASVDVDAQLAEASV